jgi:serine/threonine protein kinase
VEICGLFDNQDFFHKTQNTRLPTARCEVKLCDFGFARSVAHPLVDPYGPFPSSGLGEISEALENLKRPILTEYIGSRWYKAPEMLMNAKKWVQ